MHLVEVAGLNLEGLNPVVVAALVEALASGHVGICLSDENDAVHFVNDAFRQVFFPHAPETPFNFVDALTGAIEAGKGIRLETTTLENFDFRVRRMRRDGNSRRDFSVDMTNGDWWWVNDYRLASGWTLVVATDISSSKNEELRLRAAHADAVVQSRTDHLTRLPNRRYGLETAEAQLSAFKAGGAMLTLAILDIDHFKAVNDTYGHEVGDDVIRQFARALKAVFEDDVMLCRLGGEEFLVVAPGFSVERVGQSLRRMLSSSTILVASHKHGEIAYTFSAGVTAAVRADSVSSLISRADSALYTAKKAGRNVIHIATLDEISVA